MTTTDPSYNHKNDQPVYPEIPLEFAHKLEKNQPQRLAVGPEIPNYPKPLLLIQVEAVKDAAPVNLAVFDVRGLAFAPSDFAIFNLDSPKNYKVSFGTGDSDRFTLGRSSTDANEEQRKAMQELGLGDHLNVSRDHLIISSQKIDNRTDLYFEDVSSNGTVVSRDPELLIAAMESAKMPTADQIAKNMRTEYKETTVNEVIAEPEPLSAIGDTVDRSKLEQPAESFEHRKTIKTQPEWIKTAEEKIGWILNSPGDTSMARDFLRTLGATPEEIRAKLDPNTGDPEARVGLQNIIRRTIDELGDQNLLPERVQANLLDPYGQGGKADDFGFSFDSKQKYESRDYSAMLAVAMLDGRFNTERSDREEQSIGAGHHRTAAKMALKQIGADESYANAPDTANEELSAEQDSIRELHRTLTEYINNSGITEEIKGIMTIARDLESIVSPDRIDVDTLRDRAVFFVDKIEQLTNRLHELQTIPGKVEQEIDLRQSSKDEQRTFENIGHELRAITSRSDSISHQDHLVRLLSSLKYTDDGMHILQIKGLIRRGQLNEIARILHDIGNKVETLANR